MEKTPCVSVEESRYGTEEINLIETLDLAADTVEFSDTPEPDLTSSASFNLTWIEETSLSKFLDAVPVPTLLVDENGNIAFANRAVGRVTPDCQNRIGSPFPSIFLNELEAHRAADFLNAVILDRKPKFIEGIITIAKNRIWGKMHLRSVRVSNKRLIMVLVENLSAEKRRAILNEKYRSLVHMLPIGIAEFSLSQPVPISLSLDRALDIILHARLIDGNDQFAEIHRAKDVEELLGTPLKNISSSSEWDDDFYQDWIRSGCGIASAELDAHIGDGKIGCLECTLIGIVRKLKLYGFWLIKRDITENRRMREDSFRTQKLESLGVLAGGIAHDFNNSLTAILGNVNLAKMRSSSPESVSQRLTEVERACGRAKLLTDQLLTFAKGGVSIKRVGSIASVLKESMKFALSGSNVAFDFSIARDLWSVRFDEGQLNQVLSNLAINAQQSMPNGGTIRVVAENVVLPGKQSADVHPARFVKISVSDKGTGMPPEIVSRIFDPYFTTKTKGNGLGLATSDSIIRAHGGSISVESEIGLGSTFHVCLPAYEGDFSSTNTSPDGLSGCKGRILVVEDEEMVRDVAVKMLTLLGYDVESVRDGRQAVEAYTKAMETGRLFAAVIMNLTAPGAMGGKETIIELRKIDPKVRAVVASGYANTPVMTGCDGYGFKGVVSKPYTIDELDAVLHRVIYAEDS